VSSIEAPVTPSAPPSASEARDFTETWRDPAGVLGLFRQVQNIPIATRYMVTAFVFFLAGGLQALFLRVQLARADNTFLDAETYNRLFTMHGTTMMFLFVIPFIEALAAYVLPLMLGTRELPFPRLTALSYWTYLFGGLFLYASFLVDAVPDGGWFAYVPLTNRTFSPGLGMDFWDIGLSVAEVSAIGAAAELTVGILRMRAPGMSLHRLPLFAWSMLITAIMLVLAFTPLIVGTALLELDRKGLTRVFDPEAGGKPLLWQHLFWVFGHPEVYIMFLPAVGIVCHVVQTFARRPIVGYPAMLLSMLAIGFLSFGLWVHHMFTTGLSAVAMGFFTAASLMVAVPSGILVFGWIATLWLGRPVWTTALRFAVGFIAIFVLGGLTGVMLAAVPFNWQAHDTHFVVGHFHYTLIGGVVFPFFAALYYWLPKVTGRLLSERLGRWNFWTMFVCFNVAFFPMHVSGVLGMPRRVYTYPAGLGWEPTNLVSTIGAFGFAAGVGLFLVNLAWSLRHGQAAGPNPWLADTLEWSEPSPPPEAQFARLPAVATRHPLWRAHSLTRADPAMTAVLDALDRRPPRWRGAVIVSVSDARPIAITHVPGPTVAPFVLSVGFVFLFAAALADRASLLGIGVAISALALVVWFTPKASEQAAIEEQTVQPGRDRLPLAVAGPMSNGWWGTVALIVTLATALVTLLASYAYLLDGRLAAVRPPAWLLPAVAASAGVLASAAMVWATRRRATAGSPAGDGGSPGTHRAAPWRPRIGLAVSAALLAASAGLSGLSFVAGALVPRADAYASIVAALLGFHWGAVALALAMLVPAQLWAWLKPADPRADAIAINASLVTHFTAATGVVVFFTVYITPWLG
jgi:cytochrome c oxidase subunit I+III